MCYLVFYLYAFLLFFGAFSLIQLSEALLKCYSRPEDVYKLICAGIALLAGSVLFFYGVVVVDEEVTNYRSQGPAQLLK